MGGRNYWFFSRFIDPAQVKTCGGREQHNKRRRIGLPLVHKPFEGFRGGRPWQRCATAQDRRAHALCGVRAGDGSHVWNIGDNAYMDIPAEFEAVDLTVRTPSVGPTDTTTVTIDSVGKGGAISETR